MCNQAIRRSDNIAFDRLVPAEMDSAAASSPAAPSDEPPRVKFLCSFGGSILPRPLDGRLRYVGGETRIVSVPRDVSYDELMARMRELFEGAAVMKYQQPDEDLDALVSVVNDDDVMNMMEEYDKLGASGDGFTRLRIFLFSQQQTELEVAAAAAASHFVADEWETERRYVDALNSLTDTKPQGQPDGTDQFFGSPGVDAGMLNHLHRLNIPNPSRYGDVEPPWSPAYYSPSHHTPHDPRDFPSSPSSARCQIGVREFSDRISPEEFVRHSPVYQPHQYDHQSPHYFDSMFWLPPGAIVQEKAGFPTNLGHSNHVTEGGSNVCENSRVGLQRTHPTGPDTKYIDPRWKHGQPYMEQMSGGSEYVGQNPNSCGECHRGREAYMLNQDVKLDQGVEHRAYYNESLGHDGGWPVHHHHLNHRLEDSRLYATGTGRASEHYVIDANGVKIPYSHSHIYDGHSMHSNYINPDDTWYVRPANEIGNETLHGQQMVGGAPHVNVPGLEDIGARYGNYPSALDNLYPLQHNLPALQPLRLRRNAQAALHRVPSYEPGMAMPGISPRYSGLGVEDQTQIAWAAQNDSMQQKIFRLDGSSPSENLYGNSNIIYKDSRLPDSPHPAQSQTGMLRVDVPGEVVPLALPSSCLDGNKSAAASGDHHSTTLGTEKVAEGIVNEKGSLKEKETVEFDPKGLTPMEEKAGATVVVDSDAGMACQHGNIPVESLSFLPEMIASVKKAVLEEAEEVKAKAEENSDYDVVPISEKKEPSHHELEPGNADIEVDADPDNEQPPKIEPTTAEAEALAKGLQTIQNADLEEIRQLGSGTYGAVFHGKWKGSDVAIKRIKSSCFNGKPSERERLIADFWKEALILSSLHHPNVVSFYGVVRDGPDGTLATVTEFMINGSLKQFLQKKDRTIDRRKRLILAMDVAFGMEYLHGKNIVHFDLKCENLLVNMRDPHRPICKIGDLGLSKVKQHTLVSGGVRGTLPWMAPELLSGKSSMVTEKIDVYSFGIVMWELLTGEEPYTDMRCASIIGGIVNNTLRPQIPTWCDPEWKSLMESCWSADPAERPSFSEISQKLRKMSAAINLK